MREVTLAGLRATSLWVLLQWELATTLRHGLQSAKHVFLIRSAGAFLPPLVLQSMLCTGHVR